MTAAPAVLRSPNATREALLVVFAVGLVLAMWAGAVVAQRRAGPAAVVAPAWQTSFLALDEGGQRQYRALRSALYEAENHRAEAGQWPSPAVLAGDGVPLFDDAALRWTLQREGLSVAYVARPASGQGLSWLVLFIEPPPNALTTPGEAPAPVDEEHHTLSDGTALHVTVWTRDAALPAESDAPVFPQTMGWTQRVGR